MKLFNRPSLIAAGLLVTLMTALSGCGGGEDGTTTVGGSNGVVPINNGVVTPLPGGGAQINFSGTNVYNSGILLSGGTVTGSNNCAQYSCYCGYFSGQNSGYGGYGGSLVSACWLFSNYTHGTGGTGTVVPSPTPASPGAYGATTYTGSSIVEPGSTVTIVSTPVGYLRSNVVGSIVLSPNFVQRNFGGALPALVELAFDFGVGSQTGGPYGSGYSISGGVLLYTSGNAQSGYHGAFLAF